MKRRASRSCCRSASARARPRGLLLERHDAAAVQHQHLDASRRQRTDWRQRHRRVGRRQRHREFPARASSSTTETTPSSTATRPRSRPTSRASAWARSRSTWRCNSESSNALYTAAITATRDTDLGFSGSTPSPTLRAALSKLAVLQRQRRRSAYRYTYFTESLIDNALQVPMPLTRQYFDLRADVVGPVFSRVFTPEQRLRRSAQARDRTELRIQHITAIRRAQDAPSRSHRKYDYSFGGRHGQFNYGLKNRLLVRYPSPDRRRATAQAPRELLFVGAARRAITRDPEASHLRPHHTTLSYFSPRRGDQMNFHRWSLSVRGAPTRIVSGRSFRIEYEHSESLSRSGTAAPPAPVSVARAGPGAAGATASKFDAANATISSTHRRR